MQTQAMLYNVPNTTSANCPDRNLHFSLMKKRGPGTCYTLLSCTIPTPVQLLNIAIPLDAQPLPDNFAQVSITAQP